MKAPLVLLSALCFAAAASSPAPDAGSCHGFTSKDACVKNHCAWCECAAVPSSCYTPEEADQLPPAIFQCEKGALQAMAWDLTSVPSTSAELRSLFAAWKRAHGKSYDSSAQDELRRGVFEVNARSVAAHNSKQDRSFTMELNAFADTTWDEFQSWYLAKPQQCSATDESGEEHAYAEVPTAKDWRADGAVSPVKNQGKCGSCWSFSTTGCLESHLKLKHGQFTILSEQNLLDCAQAFDNHGCNGGLPSHAFEYVKYNGGLDTEETYPYEAKEGKCKFNTYHVGAQVEKVVNITSRNEKELKAAVGSTGPVSIAFQVVSDFRFYKSGVYESTECHSGEKDVNHAVLAVGYGVEDGKNHWIVKNSWGAEWGMDGFFQIARGSNMCGLADCASYPVVA
ncbi:papain-like cysteine protease C1 [Phytophthora cinnamomi]|uniref:papain-like cysteine protease C1 n=1 Tax=Phytophthora cinnamomi TaxID=4785 RepID=UPI00355A671F|nr:papain-like cysteine protease C1 [Phytophthora cinnamomi]